MPEFRGAELLHERNDQGLHEEGGGGQSTPSGPGEGFTVLGIHNERQVVIKVIRKFFLYHNKSFRWHLGDYEKHDFFPFEGL